MKYCKKCLMPDTRPGSVFNPENICEACTNYEKQKNTDWDLRFKKLKALCDKHRGSNGDGYDCAIAVSGGKDSHFQVYMLKEVMKMNPVLLSVGNIDWTKTGRMNLDNLSETFGCDIMMIQPNRKTCKIMFKKAFEEIGQPSWYLDSLIYAYPYTMAMNLGVKLLVYGEDVNFAYGGKFKEETPSAMLQPSNDVVKPYWEKWLADGQLTEKDLFSARAPSVKDCEAFGLEPIFLSYFVHWNSYHNYEVAKRWGFRHLGHEYEREGFIENYDQIDTIGYLLNIHLKYLKFGHAYPTDIASRWIRYGMKSREEMIPFVEENDSLLDQGVIDNFCEFTGMSVRDFWKTMDKWYNPNLFEQGKDGVWYPKFKVGIGLVK